MRASRLVRSFAALVTLLLLACSRPSATPDAEARVDQELRAALAGTARTDPEKARDVYRHPRETLEFFGLRDDTRVVELWAPEGYYTSIIAPVVRDRGALGAALLDPNGDYQASTPRMKQLQSESSHRFVDRLDRSAELYGKVTRIVMKPSVFSFGPDGAADMVLT